MARPSAPALPMPTLYQWDLTDRCLSDNSHFRSLRGTLDFCVLTFVLSACAFPSLPVVLHHLLALLRDGGQVLFRDYGVLDHKHVKFHTRGQAQLDPASYRRGDGTRAGFFEEKFTRELFESVGFETVHLQYHCVTNSNRRTGESLHKVFLHGAFRKPGASLSNPASEPKSDPAADRLDRGPALPMHASLGRGPTDGAETPSCLPPGGAP